MVRKRKKMNKNKDIYCLKWKINVISTKVILTLFEFCNKMTLSKKKGVIN